MGLDAAVYKNLSSVTATQREHLKLIDAVTGEIDYDEPTFGTESRAPSVLWVEPRLLICRCPMRMKWLAALGLLAGSVSTIGQVPQTSLQIDLQSHGWKADRVVLNGSWLPHTIDFADDDSLWMVFPTDASKGLQPRDASSEYGGKVLHIAPSGEVLAECNTSTSAWSHERVVAHRSDGFTLHRVHDLASFDAQCKEQATYPITAKMNVSSSPDRTAIYIRDKTNYVIVLSGNDLTKLKEFDLPATSAGNQVLFGDRWLMYPVATQTKGCWRSQFTRMEIASGQIVPWVTIDCARFTLLGDDHIVYSNTGGDAPLRIIGGADGSGAAYNPPHDFHLDLSVLDGLPVESSASLRIVEELIESKGRHPSLDMSGKFVGRDIVLLDMHTGIALLTVKVPMDSLTYAYALSRDGKKFAVLLNSKLTVYQVP